MLCRSNNIGVYGLTLGLIGLAIALFQFFYGPINEPEVSMLDSAKTTIMSLLDGKHATENPAAFSALNTDKILTNASVLLAFIAIFFGTIAYIRDSKKEAAYASLSIGAATLFFHFLLIAIGVVIILAVIAFILSS